MINLKVQLWEVLQLVKYPIYVGQILNFILKNNKLFYVSRKYNCAFTIPEKQNQHSAQ